MAKVNKSQQIRDYKKAHPRQKPKQIAEALGKEGVDVSAQFVSTVLSSAKKKKKKSRTKGSSQGKEASQRRATGKRAGAGGRQVTFESLLRAKKIVKEMGGIKEARKALDALEELIES